RNHPLIDQVLAIVTLPVGNTGASNSGVETIGLRNSPHGHVTAITPSSNAEAVRSDWILCYRRIDPGKDVAQIAAAEILHVGASELFSLAVTATRIRHQHVVTA